MNKLIMLSLMSATLLVLSGCASFTKLPVVTTEQSRAVIEIISVEEMGDSVKIKIDPKVTPKLLFVFREKDGYQYDNLRALFKTKLTAQGFTIVDKAEDADYTFGFDVSGGYMRAADESGTAGGVSGEQIAVAIMTGGLSLIGDLFSSKKVEQSIIQMLRSPVVIDENGFPNTKKYKARDGSEFVSFPMLIVFKQGKESSGLPLAVVNALMDSWIKQHVLSGAAPASEGGNVETKTETKAENAMSKANNEVPVIR